MDQTIEHSPNGTGHEKSEVSVRTIVVSLAFLALGVFLVFMVVIGIFNYLHRTYQPQVESQAPTQLPPTPRVQVNPSVEIQDLRAHEEHILNSYAVIDQKTGTVRVPISQAIDMLAQKGVPTHNYMDDILAGRKPPSPAAAPAARQQTGGNAGK